MKPINKFKIMKKILLILILTFSFQTLVKADDIRDFQIEGMSVGDSLLDFFSEKKIKERKAITRSIYKSKDYIRAYFVLSNSENYNVTNIHYKNNSKYEIASVSGAIMYDYTFEECFAKQKIIFDDLKKLFPTAKIKGDPKKKMILKTDKTKKSIFSTVKYVIEGGYIDVRCTILSAEFRKKYPNTGSSLQVIAHTKEFINWLNYKAYN
jgi:hypothetical protein